MTLKMRLARFGKRNSPFYNIVIQHARCARLPSRHTHTPRSAPPADNRTRFSSCPPDRTARNSKPLEVIGTYDPLPKTDPYDETGRLHKDIKLDRDRAKYWIGCGVQPSDTVWRLLAMVRRPPAGPAFPAGAIRERVREPGS